jgi:hypothetical protein
VIVVSPAVMAVGVADMAALVMVVVLSSDAPDVASKTSTFDTVVDASVR